MGVYVGMGLRKPGLSRPQYGRGGQARSGCACSTRMSKSELSEPGGTTGWGKYASTGGQGWAASGTRWAGAEVVWMFGFGFRHVRQCRHAGDVGACSGMGTYASGGMCACVPVWVCSCDTRCGPGGRRQGPTVMAVSNPPRTRLCPLGRWTLRAAVAATRRTARPEWVAARRRRTTGRRRRRAALLEAGEAAAGGHGQEATRQVRFRTPHGLRAVYA